MTIPLDLRDEAARVVLGIANAKLLDSANDAAFLLTSYRAEARERGLSDGEAWAVLFAASTNQLATVIQCSASHHRQTPAQTIQALAASIAGAPSE